MTKKEYTNLMLCSVMASLGYSYPFSTQKQELDEIEIPRGESEEDKLRIKKAKEKRERKALKRLIDKKKREQ